MDLVEKQFTEILDRFFEAASRIKEYGEMFCINKMPESQTDEDLKIHDARLYYKNNLLAELDTMILEIKGKGGLLEFLIDRKKIAKRKQEEIK